MAILGDCVFNRRDIDAFRKILAEKLSKHFDDFKLDFNQTHIYTNFVPDTVPVAVVVSNGGMSGQVKCGTLRRVVWYFEEGGVVL